MARDDRQPADQLVGDLSIFTFYKTLGLPDGRRLSRATGLTAWLSGTAWKGSASAREMALARSALLTDLEDPLRPAPKRGPQRGRSGDGWRYAGSLDTPPARPTRFVHPRLVDATVAERRRQNYEHRLMELGDLFASPFARLPADACPWALMVEAEEKQSLMNRPLLDRIGRSTCGISPTPRFAAHRSIKHVHYERDSSGFPFTISFANDLTWLGSAVRDALERDIPGSRPGDISILSMLTPPRR